MVLHNNLTFVVAFKDFLIIGTPKICAEMIILNLIISLRPLGLPQLGDFQTFGDLYVHILDLANTGHKIIINLITYQII